MAGTTVKDMLIAARVALAAMATSREPTESFLEHKSGQPFEESPISKRDGFEIVASDVVLTGAFGVTGQKEVQFDMIVKLGHCPAGVDKTREEYRVQDLQRIADVFEAYTWPVGTQTVLYKRETVDKTNPSWWLSEIRFMTVFVGDLQS